MLTKKGGSPLKSHDVLILLKLVVLERPDWTFDQLGESLGLSSSEVLQGLRRLEIARLVDLDRRAVLQAATTEFLIHAVKFFFRSSPIYRTAPFAAAADPRLSKLLGLLENIEQSEHELAAALKNYFEKQRTKPTREVILANLSDEGAPLVLSAKAANEKQKLSKEQTLAWCLSLSHDDATLARVLPVIFHKQKSQIDFRSLTRWTKALHEERTLGFFLELTSLLSRDKRMARKAHALRSQINPSANLNAFFHNLSKNPWHEKLMTMKSPEIAKKWGFKMNMEIESFASHFRKFL